MPIYEYVCEDCEYTHDALQKISDQPLADCPQCGHSALKKKISAPGFRLSGSGWYETDFKSGNKRNIAEKGSHNDKGSDKKPKTSSSQSCGTGACASAK